MAIQILGTNVIDDNRNIQNIGVATATTFVGALTGTATSTTNIPNLTGDITSVNKATTLATVNSNVGTFGGTGAIPVVTVNAKGLVTGVTTTAVTSTNDGALTLAVSGTGLSGSGTFTANQAGASSFTVTSNATNANTVSTIVARDASGNFSAGTITASLTGTASSTTNIPNLTGAITSNNTTTSLGSFTSSQLATALTDETGSGSAVFATSPTLTTPALGTPASGTLSSCTVDGTYLVGYKQIPPAGTKTSSYTLIAGDVGKFVELGSGGTVVVPASVFSAGDAIIIFNNTASSITCTCSDVTTVYKGGTDADISTFSVTTRGVANILFISATVAVVTGNLS